MLKVLLAAFDLDRLTQIPLGFTGAVYPKQRPAERVERQRALLLVILALPGLVEADGVNEFELLRRFFGGAGVFDRLRRLDILFGQRERSARQQTVIVGVNLTQNPAVFEHACDGTRFNRR